MILERKLTPLQLHRASASLEAADQTSMLPLDNKGFLQFDVISYEQYYALSVGTTKVFAQLDPITCQTLQKLDGLQGVRVKAIVESAELMHTRSTAKTNGTISLSINVYGSIGNADKVGDALSSAPAFLQHPFSLEDGREYFNPQMFRPGNQMQNLTHLVGLTKSDIGEKAISDKVNPVFESMDHTKLHNGEVQRSTNLQPQSRNQLPASDIGKDVNNNIDPAGGSGTTSHAASADYKDPKFTTLEYPNLPSLPSSTSTAVTPSTPKFTRHVVAEGSLHKDHYGELGIFDNGDAYRTNATGVATVVDSAIALPSMRTVNTMQRSQQAAQAKQMGFQMATPPPNSGELVRYYDPHNAMNHNPNAIRDAPPAKAMTDPQMGMSLGRHKRVRNTRTLS